MFKYLYIPETTNNINYFSIPYINSYRIIIQLTSLNDQLQYQLMINKNISKLPQSNRTHFFHIWPQFLKQRKKKSISTFKYVFSLSTIVLHSNFNMFNKYIIFA